MFGCLRYIRALRQIDGLCFEKRAEIKLILFGKPLPFGKPSYKNEARVPGDPVGKEWYPVPIFFKHYSSPDLHWLAIHEVRHRIQWNYPEIRLLTMEDVPDALKEKELRKRVRDIEQNPNRVKSPAREIDAHIIEFLAPPIFSKSKCAFLELMLGKAKPQKES